MPARAFVDSDGLSRDYGRCGPASKCPRGHLLILMHLDGVAQLAQLQRLNARKGIC